MDHCFKTLSLEDHYTPGRAIAVAFRLCQTYLRKNLEGTGIQARQADFLYAVSSMEGITQNQLAKMMMVSPAAVAQVAKSLEEQGFIERRASENDARKMRIFLTEKGKYVAPLLTDTFERLISVQESTLTEHERQSLRTCLTKLVRSLEQECEQAPDHNSRIKDSKQSR